MSPLSIICNTVCAVSVSRNRASLFEVSPQEKLLRLVFFCFSIMFSWRRNRKYIAWILCFQRYISFLNLLKCHMFNLQKFHFPWNKKLKKKVFTCWSWEKKNFQFYFDSSCATKEVEKHVLKQPLNYGFRQWILRKVSSIK